MKKYKLDCAFIVSKFKHHNELKETALDLISRADYEHVLKDVAQVDITKTDWHKSSDFTRDWVKHVITPLSEHMLDVYKELGYDGYTLHEIWFQQYHQKSQHGWHTHSSNFTNVYYLELPKSAPKTEIVIPYTQTDIITVDIEEGDTLVFPSFVVHRAPMNLGVDRKTIISFNVNAVYSDNIYGKGLS